MFSLTEGTLFFLDLAVNARACDKKPSLSSVVQKWVDEVAVANNSDALADGARTTTGASSTLYASPPVNQSATIGQTSFTSDGCDAASESTPKGTPEFSKISFPTAEDTRRTEMSHYNEALMCTSEMSSLSVSDSGCYHPNSNALPPRRQPKGFRGVKRKIDDTDVASDIKSDGNEGDCMDLEDPVLRDTCLCVKLTSVGTTTESPMFPPQKKVKREDASVPSLFAPPDSAQGCIPEPGMAKLQAPQRRRFDNEGYIIEVIKKGSEYTTKDLPVPCDQRWSQSFISTAILWYSVQRNIWNVQKTELASALQCIFSVVYPDIKYRVNPKGSVFVLTLQRIHEWRNSFGSSALAMMLHFFTALDSANDVHAAAEFLSTDFRFLRADPDTCEPTEPFRSPFLLILLAITHLGDVAAHVDVPGWDTRAMAAGEGGDGVVAIASAALERALTFFRDGTLDIDHILLETACCPEAHIPRSVLDVLAGAAAPPALRFSSANWSGPTAAYRDAVRKRGTTFVRESFDAAWAKRRRIVGAGTSDEDGDDDVESGVGVSAVPDPRALL